MPEYQARRNYDASVLRRMFADKRGATAIEYALIASGISVFILGALTTLGAKIISTFYDGIASLF